MLSLHDRLWLNYEIIFLVYLLFYDHSCFLDCYT